MSFDFFTLVIRWRVLPLTVEVLWLDLKPGTRDPGLDRELTKLDALMLRCSYFSVLSDILALLLGWYL